MIHTRSSARGVLHGPFSYINKVGRGRDSDLAKMESFAKKLASSGLQMRHVDTNKVDGSVRDKAFKSLRMWLEKRCGELEEGEYLRLWKALFYCTFYPLLPTDPLL